jgi:Putative Ig domain/Subtilase family/Pro-kumamolisin, activation domain
VPGSHRHRLLALALAVIAMLGALASASAASIRSRPLPRAGSASTARPVASVQSGGGPARATAALAPRDPAALAAYARAVTDPGSVLFRHFLTVSQFAQHFGPTAAAIATVRGALIARGLTPGTLSANKLALSVRSTGAPTPRGLTTSPDGQPPAAGGARHAGAGDVSSPLGGSVQGIIGVDVPAPSASVILGAARHDGPVAGLRWSVARGLRRSVAHRVSGAAGPEPCAAARSAGSDGSGYTANQISSAYGLSSYYAAGDEARNVTIALYELEPFRASDIAGYQSCYGTHTSVSTVAVDGGPGTGAGSGEAAMDVEDLIGLAPRASIRVYEGPPSGVGAYDTYNRIMSDDSAQVISTSWGLCEALEGAVPAAVENTLFEEAAVQGQSLLASAGDQGSDDCGDRQQAVDDPASQPWVTGVGATSLRPSGDVVWNDWLGATGGGVSRLWARPGYQDGVALPQSDTACGSSGDGCREVPDISVDGDPNTGYVAYYLGAWRTVGGTSVSAPTIAALTALADASPACGGRKLGFLNPGLYRAAAGTYAADFRDVTSGENGFDLVPGFAAGRGYDMASGLGTPGVSLGRSLCGAAAPPNRSGSPASTHGPQAVKASHAVTLRRPPNRSGRVGVMVDFRVSARDLRGLKLAYSATGLPAGLAINRRTGLISGVPWRVGSRTVRVRAADARGNAAAATFRWTIAGRPASGR